MIKDREVSEARRQRFSQSAGPGRKENFKLEA